MRCMPARKVYIEIIRILAIYFIVWNHTSAYAMPFQTGDIATYSFIMLCISAFCKVAVPLFFMISGALLIPKQESISVLLKKRVFRIALAIVLFVAIQYAYYFFTAPEGSPQLGWTAFIKDLYHGSASNTYVVHAPAVWFLYAYMGMLLVMPFLRLLADRMTKTHIMYLIGVSCILGYVVPLAYTILTGDLPDDNGILMRSRFLTGARAYLIYVLLGYYLEHRIDIKRINRKHCCILAMAAICCTVLSCLSEFITVSCTQMTRFHEDITPFTGLLPIMSGAVYILIKKLYSRENRNTRHDKAIGYIGAATFTVFLVENILRDELHVLIKYLGSNYLVFWGLALLATAGGLLIGLVLKRIPYINKLV